MHTSSGTEGKGVDVFVGRICCVSFGRSSDRHVLGGLAVKNGSKVLSCWMSFPFFIIQK